MLTRCPNCATRFRVTADQLKVRLGRVRCGQCQTVFNALDSLIEEAPAASLPGRGQPEPVGIEARLAPPSAPAAATTPAAAAEGEAPPAVAVPSAPTPSAATAFESVAAEAAAAELPASPHVPADFGEQSEPGLAAEAAATADDPAEPAAAGGASDPAVAEADGAAITAWSESETAPRRRWPWVVGSVLALAALALQALLAFRVELAVVAPELRPTLVALCDIAGCEVGLPAKVALVGIETSDLHPDSARPGRLMLSATLKNRAPFAQQYPHLELTLTDTADKAVARKVLAPSDYLPFKAVVADGMPSNADIAVGVGIEAAQLPASGYRLYLFYP